MKWARNCNQFPFYHLVLVIMWIFNEVNKKLGQNLRGNIPPSPPVIIFLKYSSHPPTVLSSHFCFIPKIVYKISDLIYEKPDDSLSICFSHICSSEYKCRYTYLHFYMFTSFYLAPTYNIPVPRVTYLIDNISASQMSFK